MRASQGSRARLLPLPLWSLLLTAVSKQKRGRMEDAWYFTPKALGLEREGFGLAGYQKRET